MTQIVYRIQNGTASERSTVDGHPKRQTKGAEVWAIFTSSTATNICICFAAMKMRVAASKGAAITSPLFILFAAAWQIYFLAFQVFPFADYKSLSSALIFSCTVPFFVSETF